MLQRQYLQNIYNCNALEHDYFGDKKSRVQIINPLYSANGSIYMKSIDNSCFNKYIKAVVFDFHMQ